MVPRISGLQYRRQHQQGIDLLASTWVLRRAMSVFLLHTDTDPTEFAGHIFGGGLHGAKLRPDGNQGRLGLSPGQERCTNHHEPF